MQFRKTLKFRVSNLTGILFFRHDNLRPASAPVGLVEYIVSCNWTACLNTESVFASVPDNKTKGRASFLTAHCCFYEKPNGYRSYTCRLFMAGDVEGKFLVQAKIMMLTMIKTWLRTCRRIPKITERKVTEGKYYEQMIMEDRTRKNEDRERYANLLELFAGIRSSFDSSVGWAQ